VLTESNLRELLEFSAPDPVLSVYLNTVPAEGNADAYKLRLRNMLKGVNLPQDTGAVERYFDHGHDWSGRGVAVFSCASHDFFRAYSLATPLPNMVYVSDRPAVKPLADVLDAYGGYGVVLTDKQGARLFFFHLGSLREQEGVMGETVKHVKRGGASTFQGRRGGIAGTTSNEDEVIDRNMKESVDFAIHFFEENHVRRILIGGTDENVAMFRGMLSKAWQSLVVGSFPMSMTASHAEVMARAMQIGQEAEHLRESRLVDSVITSAAKAGGGVVGLKATLDAVHNGRVQTLLVCEDFQQAGYRCKGCGSLFAQKSKACVLCGGALEIIPDVVELAVQEVMHHGGGVEVAHAAPALVEAGKIGAVLRY
jgi:peptide chain release factor subunit 1